MSTDQNLRRALTGAQLTLSRAASELSVACAIAAGNVTPEEGESLYAAWEAVERDLAVVDALLRRGESGRPGRRRMR